MALWCHYRPSLLVILTDRVVVGVGCCWMDVGFWLLHMVPIANMCFDKCSRHSYNLCLHALGYNFLIWMVVVVKLLVSATLFWYADLLNY